MKITAIKQQVKHTGRYSIFVDGKYAFSLSDGALIDSGLSLGTDITASRLGELKQASADDKMYNALLGLIARRLRSRWELETYLKRKKVSPALVDQLLNKLSVVGLVDDAKFAEAWVNDRRLLRPTSRRKMTAELRLKRVPDETIKQAIGEEAELETTALQGIINKKRQQTKYKDDLKLMQYLARQGFSYGDIKDALASKPDDA